MDGGAIRVDAGVALRLSDVALSGNSAASGAAIFMEGSMLTIERTVIDSNTAAGRGGAIAADAGSLMISNSSLTANTAASEGGAIDLRNEVSALSLVDSQVRDNAATGGNGGGLYLTAPDLAASISGTTIDGNSALWGGGGVYWDALRGRLTLSSSAVSRNNVSDEGGGLWTGSGTLTLTNSPFGENESTSRGAGVRQTGGRVTILNVTIATNSSSPGGAALSMGLLSRSILQNTIVADNTGGDCGRSVVSLGNNLDSDGGCLLDQPGDLSAAAANLGPLALNAGPTETHILITGRAAIDAANPGACPALDQRGFERSLGGVRDIGAYEEILPRFPLVVGWNLVGWTDAAELVANATASIEGAFDALFTYDSATQQFRRFDADAPPVLNTLTELQQGDGLWILLRSGGVDWPQPLITSARAVPLDAGFNLVTWTGPDLTSVEVAVAGFVDRLLALSIWDEEQQRFKRFSPDAPAVVNTATELRFGEGVWIQLSAVAVWNQPSP